MAARGNMEISSSNPFNMSIPNKWPEPINLQEHVMFLHANDVPMVIVHTVVDATKFATTITTTEAEIGKWRNAS